MDIILHTFVQVSKKIKFRFFWKTIFRSTEVYLTFSFLFPLLKTLLSEKQDEICKKNEEASADHCSTLLQSIFKPLEQEVAQGIYAKPGGHSLFLQKMEQLKAQYRQQPGKGTQVSFIPGTGAVMYSLSLSMSYSAFGWNALGFDVLAENVYFHGSGRWKQPIAVITSRQRLWSSAGLVRITQVRISISEANLGKANNWLSEKVFISSMPEFKWRHPFPSIYFFPTPASFSWLLTSFSSNLPCPCQKIPPSKQTNKTKTKQKNPKVSVMALV